MDDLRWKHRGQRRDVDRGKIRIGGRRPHADELRRLVGMGSVILSGAVIGAGCLIAGGAVVLEGAVCAAQGADGVGVQRDAGLRLDDGDDGLAEIGMRDAEDGAVVNAGVVDEVGLDFGGVEIRRKAIHETADGRRLLILHGDEFDVVTLAHRWIAHVGDSRCYLLKPGALWQLTRDHSLVGELLAAAGKRVFVGGNLGEPLAAHADEELLEFSTSKSPLRWETTNELLPVAPDGYVPGERLRALTGSPPRVTLPARAREVVTGLRWRFERGPIPPGLVAYTRWPWVISNDRLVADGWRPTVTNEQAYVEGTEAPWWTMVSPKRRQELALGGAATLLAAVVAVVVKALRAGRVTAAVAVQQARR